MVVADFVNRTDVGMVESRRRLGFALKASQRLRVFGDLIGEKLQRNETAQFRVFGLVDHAHTAAAEFLENVVVRDGLANHWRECYVQERTKSMKAEEMAKA